MANEITYSRIRHLLPDFWEAALFYLEFSFTMPGLVTFFSDQTGMTPRNVTEYVQGSVQDNLGELEDLTPNLLARKLLSRLTPKEIGMQHLITDRRVESDDASIIADAGSDIGYQMGKQMEVDLLSDFASLTGGLIDKTNASLTWLDIYNARAILSASAVPGPYNLVLNDWQWLDLATAANIAAVGTSTTSQPQLRIRDDIQSQYYLGSLGDIAIYRSNLITIDGSGDAIGALFNRNAMALDLRRGMRIEPFRDPSLRASELNGSMIYAHGIWRPTWGVQIKSDSTAAGSAVTQASLLVITGFGDDLTTTTGQVETFTFTVSNTGTVVSRDILVTFTVDSDFTYVSDSENMGIYSSSAKTWSGFELAPGQTAVINLKYSIAGDGNMVGAITSSTPTITGTPAATVTIDNT